MRAFLSINLSQELHQSIEEAQRRLEGDALGIRWTRADHCHLTLKFFGEISEATAQTLASLLVPVGSHYDPFVLELGGIGQFPPHGPLSILWMGVMRGESVLRAIEREIHQTLIDAKIPFDKKPFSPHLTIARARKGEKAFLHNAKTYRDLKFGMVPVDHFCLMESVLQPSGPIYTVRKRFDLGTQAETKQVE